MEQHILKHNSASLHFNPVTDLPEGFLDFLLPLHRAFTPRQQELIKQRARVLAASHIGETPDHLPPSLLPSAATTGEWRIELPVWCADQRNQMTGPAGYKFQFVTLAGLSRT